MTENQEQPSTGLKSDQKGFVDVVWNWFRSTRLAIFLLIFISITAIIGTLIPQNPTPDQIAGYGEGTKRLFQMIGFFDLYHSRWFDGALALLCINLLICSLERIPQTMNQIRLERVTPAAGDPERMRMSAGFDVKGAPDNIADKIRAFLKKEGGRIVEDAKGDNRFFLLNRGRYSRLGVYVLHFSIILVVFGAIVGNILGYRGQLLIEEGTSADKFIRYRGEMEEQPLGFAVACKSFSFSLDPTTGMPGNFTSKLEIIDGGKKISEPTVMVNHPISYKGIGIYQAAYRLICLQVQAQCAQSVTVAVSRGGKELGRADIPAEGDGAEIPGGGKMKLLETTPDPQNQTIIGATLELDGGDAGSATIELREGEHAVIAGAIQVEIIVRALSGDSELGRVKVSQGEDAVGPDGSKLKVLEYSSNFEVHGKSDKMVLLQVTQGGQSSNHRLFGGFPNFDKMNTSGDRYYQLGEVTVKPSTGIGGDYDFKLVGADGLYATILDVNYDPGVWFVWLGCLGLFAGLWMALFWSHRKIWIKMAPGRVSISGQANRNTQAFEEQFKKFADKFKKNLT